MKEDNIDNLTLKEVYNTFDGDAQQHIPFMVWLFENPDSPLHLPGKIYLREHDYLHILLDRGISPEDEAFVVGFTMGNDPSITDSYIRVFKLISRHLYPKLYRFTKSHFTIFDIGIYLGRRTPFKRLNAFDFAPYLDWSVVALRQKFGINPAQIREYLGPSDNKPWLQLGERERAIDGEVRSDVVTIAG